MDEIRVVLDLRVYEEQPGCSESITEFKDERLRYQYVELGNNGAEDISDKIERMYFIAMIKFLQDYIEKHPGLNKKIASPYVLLSREEYDCMKFQIAKTMG